MYDVKVIADSVAPHGSRLITLQITFPRFILAEVNTHRQLSRNSASSRAIPPEKMIERAQNEPFVPETFNRRVKGMGVGEALVNSDQEKARRAWLNARDHAVANALVLLDLDCDKSRINRLLEPFLWHTALITATEWSNFFALRDHPDAQPELQIIARMMRTVMDESDPERLAYGDWHLPYVSDDERVDIDDEVGRDPEYKIGIEERWAHVSAGRCFTVSYDRLDEIMSEDPDTSYGRSKGGAARGHWSPLEHPAVATKPFFGERADSIEDWHGNFRGWRSLRKFYPEESDFQIVRDRIAAAADG